MEYPYVYTITEMDGSNGTMWIIFTESGQPCNSFPHFEQAFLYAAEAQEFMNR